MPYGIKAGNFYYDWLMVYGGIFPTFPYAEYCKTWLKPWDFKLLKQSDDEVTVSMSFKDNFEYSAAPAKFKKSSTGIEATYYVTLKADRAALDTRVVLKNPTKHHHIRILDLYDALTEIGSEKSQTTGAPKSSHRSKPTARPTGLPICPRATRARASDKSHFEKLRYFKNWLTMGIAYAAPYMQSFNFWARSTTTTTRGSSASPTIRSRRV